MTCARLHLFDTTRRDGAQTQGIDFNVQDKHTIAQALDCIGIDYIEGGWPGANPTDSSFFAAPPARAHAKLSEPAMQRSCSLRSLGGLRAPPRCTTEPDRLK